MSALDLFQGTLDVLVLQALSHGARHGYDVARFIRDRSGETFRILDGALYTSLHRMEERGWIQSEWGISDRGKRAKFYQLTRDGRRALKSESLNWKRYVEAVANVMKPVS